MALRDSLDKIIFSYFSAVTNQEFTYKGKTVEPKTLKVSSLLLRGFTCPPNCGACCPRFTLDYLPNEPHPYELKKRMVEFNNQLIPIYSDMQKDDNDHFCGNLNKENGRCGIHGKQPFSCDFELIRFLNSTDDTRPDYVTQKLFGRKWAMLNVRGTRGTSCEMTAPDTDTIQEVRRKMGRLEQWCFHFGLLDTKIPDILEWVDNVAEYAIRGKKIENHTIPTIKRKTLI